VPIDVGCGCLRRLASAAVTSISQPATHQLAPVVVGETVRSAAGLFDTHLCPAPGCANDFPCRDHPYTQPRKRSDQHLYAALALISVGQLDVGSPNLADAVGRHTTFCVHDPRRVLGLITETATPNDILYRRLAARALQCAEVELWLRELRTALAGELPSMVRYDKTFTRREDLVARCRALGPADAREAVLNTSRRPDILLAHQQTHSLTPSQADDDWRRARTQILEHRLIDLVEHHGREVLAPRPAAARPSLGAEPSATTTSG
jgi:hypothetical protein